MNTRVHSMLCIGSMFATALMSLCPTIRAAAQDEGNSISGGGELQFRRRRSSLRPPRDLDLIDRAFPDTGDRRTGGPGRYGVEHDLSDAFFRGTVAVSRRLGCEPLDLLAVMMRESSLRPDAWNRSSSAVGLIQFLPSTLAHLGWTGTVEDFRSLSAEEQLPWVERYLRPYSSYGLYTAGRVYQAVFMPMSLRQGLSSAATLIDSRGSYADRYTQNRGLDRNGDGRITVGELQEAIDRCRATSAWEAVEARFREAMGGDRQTRLAGSRRGQSSAFGSRSAQPYDAPMAETNRYSENGLQDEGAPDLRTRTGLAEALQAIGFTMRHRSLTETVRAFQRWTGLIDDGIVGPRTREALATELQAAGGGRSL